VVPEGGVEVVKQAFGFDCQGLACYAIASAFFASGILGLLLATSSEVTDVVPGAVRIFTYTPHDPILIDGNAGFTNASGVVWGSGTESDPYIIEGWDINASTASGIEVSNTDAYFSIRNVSVHDGRPNFYDAIRLQWCSNARIDGCDVEYNWQGVIMVSCSECSIVKCSFRYNGYGLDMQDSCENIVVDSSQFVESEEGGLQILWSTRITLTNNTFWHDGIEIQVNGWGSDLGNNNWISDSNTVNGHPILYYKNESGLQLTDVVAGQIIMANCTDCAISNAILDNTTVGIAACASVDISATSCKVSSSRLGFSFAYCNNVSIDDSSTNSCDIGIGLGECQGAVISNTHASGSEEGISMTRCWSSLVQSCNCSGNSYGIVASGSWDNTLRDNICNWNTNGGIGLLDSGENTLIDNVCSNNNFYGITVSYEWSTNNTLISNDCSNNNWEGIAISSSNNTLIGNNCSSNRRGIYMYMSSASSNKISQNEFWDNIDYGINVSSGSFNLIWNNTFYHNNGAGDSYDPAHSQAYDDGSNNHWNSTDGFGNFWSGCTTPYPISGSAGAEDYYPRPFAVSSGKDEILGMSSDLFILLMVVALVTLAFVVFVYWRRKKKHGEASSKQEEPPLTQPKN
jgi:parallel beta-helix repeat protein